MKTEPLATLAVLAHLFAGWTTQAPMNSDQVTMTVPVVAPAGEAEFAWVAAANDDCDFTQVGWMWDPSLGVPWNGPTVFAYTAVCGKQPRWYYGPAVAPGGTVTARIVRQGTTYTDEFLNPAMPGTWQVAQVDELDWKATWVVDVESYGPMERVCFANRGCVG